MLTLPPLLNLAMLLCCISIGGRTLRYIMRHTVKSGHNDTSLGNSIINAAVAFYAMKKLGYSCSIIVAGDDLLIACYSVVDGTVVARAESELGIMPEARCFTSFAQTSFISGIFLSDSGSIKFVPSPGRLLARLWWTTKPPPPKKVAEYTRSIVRGLLPVCHGLPIIRVFLNAFDSEGPTHVSEKGYAFRGAHYTFSDGVLSSFAARYGLSVHEVLDCEVWLRTLPCAPLVLSHPVLSRIVAVDTADIGDRDWGLDEWDQAEP